MFVVVITNWPAYRSMKIYLFILAFIFSFRNVISLIISSDLTFEGEIGDIDM